MKPTVPENMENNNNNNESRSSSMSSLPTSPNVTKSSSPGVKVENPQKIIEQMRKHISKLKVELEAEKFKNKQSHRDKVSEIKQIKEECNKLKEEALETLQVKIEQSNQNKIQKLRETLNREKDNEIRQILRYKDEEIKEIKASFSQEKEDAIKVSLELQKKALLEQTGRDTPVNRPSSGNSALIVKYQRELKTLKDTRKTLEEQLRVRTNEFIDKETEIRNLKQQHDIEISRLRRETELEEIAEAQGMKKVEEDLQAMDQELCLKNSLIARLKQEKQELGRKLAESRSKDTGNEDSSKLESDDQSTGEHQHDQDRAEVNQVSKKAIMSNPPHHHHPTPSPPPPRKGGSQHFVFLLSLSESTSHQSLRKLLLNFFMGCMFCSQGHDL